MDWSETNRDLLEDPEMHRQNNVQNLEAEVKALPQKKRKRVLSIETAKKVHQPKLSELRRQLPLLKKKLAEQSKLLKMREITVLKLKLEIQMKAQHLELTKEMKDEAKNFRKWKQQTEKELIQAHSSKMEIWTAPKLVKRCLPNL